MATAANAREVALPVLRAARNSVRVSLCFCLNICTNCRVRSPSGPTLGQYSKPHLKRREGLGFRYVVKLTWKIPVGAKLERDLGSRQRNGRRQGGPFLLDS